MAENFNLDDLKNENLGETTEVNEEVVADFTDQELENALDKIAERGAEEIREVDISEIAPAKPKEADNSEFVNELFGELDRAVEKEKEKITKLQEEYIESSYQQQMEENDSKEEAAEETTTEDNLNLSDVKSEEASNESDSFSLADLDFDDEDFEDDDEESDEEDKEQEEQINNLKASIKEKIVAVEDKVDLTTYTIGKKPVAISKLLSTITPQARTADWVLYSTGRPVTVTELSGSELEKINPNNTSRNRFNTFKEIYSVIYKHIQDPNKPETLEAWLKTLKFFDTDHIYFAIYKACFEGNNSVPYNCPECKKMFIVDTPIENMVKYASDEVKEEVRKILEKDSTSPEEYQVDLIQISDSYVAAIKDPSVYEVIFETAALDENFTKKYSNLLGLISYIDELYYIDRATNQLQPIGYKMYPENIAKTTKNKIRTYHEVLSTLSSDQYYELSTHIAKLNTRGDKISYILPEVTCPQCGHVIPEAVESADRLLFTRHQLGAIASI